MIRLAFVGCGRVVEAFHQPALARTTGAQLTAVVDADPARAQALADRAGAPRPRVAAAVRDIAGACDAAIVALPNYLHADACVTLLESGCHVLVEKPMATTVADCDRMIAAARSARAFFGVAMVRRFIPAYQLVHALVAKRLFGSIRKVKVSEGVAYNWPATTGFFVKRAEAGGGVLVDFGSHAFDALTWWLGPLTVVSYEDDAYGGVEAECRVKLTTSDGAPVSVDLTRLRHVACAARIEWDRATLEIDLRTGAAHVSIEEIPQSIHGQVGVEESQTWTPGTNPFVLQLRSFVNEINARAGVAPTALAGHQVARLFEACATVRQPIAGPASPAVEPAGARP